jgi:hypothetical protein
VLVLPSPYISSKVVSQQVVVLLQSVEGKRARSQMIARRFQTRKGWGTLSSNKPLFQAHEISQYEL